MSDKILKIMKKHLESAEKYVGSLSKASSAADCVKAMNKCAVEVRGQYAEFGEIASEYRTLITSGKASKELTDVCVKAGECFGRRTVELLPKLSKFMAHPDYVAAQQDLDDALDKNPIFSA